ncbi:hypothetical protein D2917_31165 (plasmid) [Cupriavidus oxalaticus]|uniref:Preprotein translocase subunit SecA n=1 Tax=Cupriavidus oxalaticus TaxID=96344 RepID=A0A5P3VUH2_9BURK|nr:hypothetical protein D2917_31165 [Cupriavidus oxalaticus]
MLTPHEVATLILIRESAPNLSQLDRSVIDSLIERKLVRLDAAVAGQDNPRITAEGCVMLGAISRNSVE